MPTFPMQLMQLTCAEHNDLTTSLFPMQFTVYFPYAAELRSTQRLYRKNPSQCFRKTANQDTLPDSCADEPDPGRVSAAPQRVPTGCANVCRKQVRPRPAKDSSPSDLVRRLRGLETGFRLLPSIVRVELQRTERKMSQSGGANSAEFRAAQVLGRIS